MNGKMNLNNRRIKVSFLKRNSYELNLDLWMRKAHQDKDKFIFYARPFLADFNNDLKEEIQGIFLDAVLIAVKNVRNNVVDFSDYKSFFSYIFATARYLLMNYIRRKNSLPISHQDMENMITSEKNSINMEEFTKVFWEVFEDLREDEQKILELSLIQEYSNEKVASILGFSEKIVRKRKSRYKQKLAELIRQRKTEWLHE